MTLRERGGGGGGSAGPRPDTWVPPAGPINREMRHLISSLQNHNHQLKGDVQRYKRKLREVQAEINKVGGASRGGRGIRGCGPFKRREGQGSGGRAPALNETLVA